jgi:hypothetical protein
MKRRLLKLGLLILAGAIINVAVAWGCSIWSTARNQEDPLRSGDNSYASDYTRENAIKLRHAVGSWTWGRVTVIGASWYQLITTDKPDSYLDRASGYHIHVAGWPIPGPCCFGTSESPPQFIDGELVLRPSWHGGIRAPSCLGPKLTSHYLLPSIERPLPLSPVTVGFAINTIFYAAIVWLLWFGPGTIRRWRRIKRGLCPACGYPVGTNPLCTECGGPVRNPETVKDEHGDRGVRQGRLS